MTIGVSTRQTERIGFVLIPSFSMIAFSSAIEPLRLANRCSGRNLYSWRLISEDGAPAFASNAVAVNVDESVTQLRKMHDGLRAFDVVFVCSGIGVERYHNGEILAWLRRIERQGTIIGSLCTGAYVLAQAGLLQGHRCAIHWESLPAFSERFPDIEVSADLYEVDGRRPTCSGGTASLDMMLNLISLQHGAKLATDVSEMCLIDRMREPNDRQRLPLRTRLGIHSPKLIASVEIMEATLGEPIPQAAIARRVGLSRRQLERLFARHLGRSPAQYYLELRLERSRNLLYQTEMPIVDLAMACGFASPSHFSKCYRQMYGKSPRQERSAAV